VCKNVLVQFEAEATVLDINAGVPRSDEVALFPQVMQEEAARTIDEFITPISVDIWE